jgi:hypothetical protein
LVDRTFGGTGQRMLEEVAWHGGTSPSHIARRLRLTEEQLRRIEEKLRNHFSDVRRRQLPSLDFFVAVRSG